jgi:SAM-dependent methyltransferase
VHGVEDSWAGRDERVFENLPVERELLHSLPPGATILDLGCGDGSHLSRLATGGRVVGMDLSVAGMAGAQGSALLVAAAGERLPFPDGSFDLVYVSHVLHHAADHRAVLREIRRVLAPGAALLLLETCEDNPLMRLARTIRPRWEAVPVRSRFRYAELLADVRRAGFEVRRTGQFNVLYWMWGFARRGVRPLERLLPQVIRLELVLVRRLRRFGAYGYVLARTPRQSDQDGA